MSDECSRGMDGACKGAGLYERLVDVPLPEAAVPGDCDETSPYYSIDVCFNWLEPKIIRGTMSFDLIGFRELPMEIDLSFIGKYDDTFRFLQTSTKYQNTKQSIKTKVKEDPVSKSDPDAILPASLSKMDTASIEVDKATAVSKPDTKEYLKEFSAESKDIELSHNYLSFTIYALMIVMGLLL